MDQETGNKKDPGERSFRIFRKILGRVDRGGELSPALREVLRKIEAKSEIDAAIDAGREEGIEPTDKEIKRIKS